MTFYENIVKIKVHSLENTSVQKDNENKEMITYYK